MSQTTLKLSVLATLLLLAGGISAQAADETFTVRIENVSAANALKLSNGKTEPVGVAPVLYLVQAPLQAGPNTGPAEHGVVRPITEVKDGFHYPTVPEVLRVTITPGPGPAATR